MIMVVFYSGKKFTVNCDEEDKDYVVCEVRMCYEHAFTLYAAIRLSGFHPHKPICCFDQRYQRFGGNQKEWYDALRQGEPVLNPVAERFRGRAFERRYKESFNAVLQELDREYFIIVCPGPRGGWFSAVYRAYQRPEITHHAALSLEDYAYKILGQV